MLSGAHYQERESAILGLSIRTVAKVSIFRFPFCAKESKGVLSGQSQYEILLRHSWHSFLFTKKMADESEYQMSTSGSGISSEISSEESSSSPSKDTEEETDYVRKRKQKRTEKSSTSASHTQRRGDNTRRKKQRASKKAIKPSLDDKDIKILATWVFNTEEASKVEKKVQEELLESSRIKAFPSRQEFVEHLTSELEQQNFTLLVTGFCRKFSTLIEQCSKEDKKVRKAVFACSWMKVMSNFQCGKATQERMILERCLVNAPPATTEDIHCVISLIHELVYHVIHDHICSSKADQCGTEPSTSSLTKRRYALPILWRGTTAHGEIKTGNTGREKEAREAIWNKEDYYGQRTGHFGRFDPYRQIKHFPSFKKSRRGKSHIP